MYFHIVSSTRSLSSEVRCDCCTPVCQVDSSCIPCSVASNQTCPHIRPSSNSGKATLVGASPLQEDKSSPTLMFASAKSLGDAQDSPTTRNFRRVLFWTMNCMMGSTGRLSTSVQQYIHDCSKISEPKVALLTSLSRTPGNVR